MALITLPDNGQQFELEDEIAGSDDLLKAALRPLYPEIGDATIRRETKDGQMVVSVVKQAGRKGLGIFEELDRAEGVETKELPLSSVRTDGGTQTRAVTNFDVAREYSEAIAAGAVFPPVKVVQEEDSYWLYDGFHTTVAHQLAGKETINATIRPGTRRDAVLLAVGANQSHGLRRSNEDKRRAVTILLQDAEWGQWSDRVIAERSGVSHTYVGDIRRELFPSVNEHQMPQERLVQRGSQTYTLQPPVTPEALKARGQQTFEEGEEPEIEAEERFDEVAAEEAAPEPVVAAAPTPAPVKPMPTPAAPAPAPTPPPPAPVPAKPVPFDQAEITLTITLRPDDGKDGGRPVFLTAQCAGCTPAVKMLRLSSFWPWQTPLEDVLTSFRRQIAEALDDGQQANVQPGEADALVEVGAGEAAK